MKTSIFITILLCFILSLLVSCRQFLDVEPRGKVILKTLSDFDLLLNSPLLSGTGEQLLNTMADDTDLPTVDPMRATSTTLSYIWAEQLNATINERPLFWGYHYANIYAFNAVINKVDSAAGSIQQKQRLKAEALLGRALEYLYLVNLYSKTYDATRANTDLAVPFVTSTDIRETTPPRATIGFIYDRILSDIHMAIPFLPANNNSNKFRGSVNAAYSVLARTYYYMANYAEAAKYAGLALQERTTELLDYNTVTNQNDIPRMVINKQEIYARNGNSHVSGLPVSLDFLKLFDRSDRRLQLFYTNLGDFTFPERGIIQFSFVVGVVSFGTSVSEMKLIIAEAASRTGDLQLALNHINDIRRHRTASADYQPFYSSDSEVVLQRVLLERRLELAFKGMRWLDMRKLDAEDRMPTVRRLDANGRVIARLEKHSPKYVLKIPASVIKFNPDMPQN